MLKGLEREMEMSSREIGPGPKGLEAMTSADPGGGSGAPLFMLALPGAAGEVLQRLENYHSIVKATGGSEDLQF